MKTLRDLLSGLKTGDGVLLAAFVAAALSGWRFGWQSVGWQNMILLLAAAVGAWSLRTARKSERQKATLAFLRDYHNSETVRQGAKILNQPGENRSNLCDEQKFLVKEFLNQLELLAIGLKRGIYDDAMVRDAMETAIARYYMRGKAFIEEVRREDGDVREVAYEHFEKLAMKIMERLKKPR